MNISRAPSKRAGGQDLPKVPSAELDEQFAVSLMSRLVKEKRPFFLFSDTRASRNESVGGGGLAGCPSPFCAPPFRFARPASHRTTSPPRAKAAGPGSGPKSPNLAPSRPTDRPHPLGGWGGQWRGRGHAERRRTHRARRIGRQNGRWKAPFGCLKNVRWVPLADFFVVAPGATGVVRGRPRPG